MEGFKIVDDEIKKILKELSKKETKIHFPTCMETFDAISKVEQKSIDYQKQNCNMKVLKEEQQLLKDAIRSKENKDFFEVFNMECTTGKTYTMINSLPYYLDDIAMGLLPREGVLIVLRQISECEKYAEELNKLFKKNVAVSATSDEYKTEDYEESKRLKKELLINVSYAPIVFITHSKYLTLCSNEQERKVFTKNRRLLIIDEDIDNCKIIRLDDKWFNIIIKELKEDDKKILTPLLQPIQKKLAEGTNENNEVYNFKRKNIDLSIIDKVANEDNLSKYNKKREHIKDFLFTIKCIYCSLCIVSTYTRTDYKSGLTFRKVEISTTNFELKMWMLKKNIILDASAPLNMKYDLNTRLYHNLNLEPVLDHSNWTINYIWANSTKTAKSIETTEVEEDTIFKNYSKEDAIKKQKYKKNFYKCCSKVIENLGVENTLAIGTKEEHIIEKNDMEIKYNPFKCNIPEYNIVHYGDITGKREYGNLKNVLVFHTFNYKETDYILQYLYYSNITSLKDGTTFERITQSSILGNIPIFKNQKLQEYKEKTMANHLYQAIKRVNREMIYNTNVTIVSIYLGAILYVRDMLRNCKCEEDISFYAMFNMISYGNEKSKQNYNDYDIHIVKLNLSARVYQIRELFKDILNNNIPKDLPTNKISEHILQLKLADLRNYLNIETKQCSNALADNILKEFLNDNVIIYDKCVFHFILY